MDKKLLKNNTSKKYFKIVKYEKKSIYQKQIDNVINLNKKIFSLIIKFINYKKLIQKIYCIEQ